MLHLDLAAVVGILVAAAAGLGRRRRSSASASRWPWAPCTSLALLPYVRGRKIPPNAEKVLAAVDDWLREYQPETVLYFSGSKDSAYQVNMWLETMEQLDGQAAGHPA